MARILLALISLLAATGVIAAPARWVEGRNYTVLDQPQHTSVPAGKVEVMEVFSYGCPACNAFQPVVDQLRQHLPANAQMVFLPAAFKPEEDWPMFQRAYFTAQALGVADKAHQGIFDAVWKSGELAVVDPATHRLRQPQPSIEDAARCYGRLTGVKPDAFLATARSFGVDAKMRAADAQVIAMQVPGTPCIVVDGKYRVELRTLTSADDLIDLVRFLVGRAGTH